jgi:uncharacterized membrane protein YczE
VLLRRLVQLYVGLILFGITVAMIVLSGLGNAPWDVLHEGLFRQTGIGTGWWAVILGAVVLALWIPLDVRIGLGTVSNVIVVGATMEVVFALFEAAQDLPVQIALVVGGVVGNGIACGMYIGARFGPGPRDGLMTGIAARGHSIRAVRTGIEVTVLALGAILGGTVGAGTLLYALGIGPIVHRTLPFFDRGQPRSTMTVVDLTTAVAVSPGLSSSSSAASRDISDTIR